MVERLVLEELASFESEGNDVLSVYLLTDPSRRYKDECRLVLRGLLEEARQLLPKDADRVRRFVDMEFDWQARGLAVFSSEEAGFWRAYSLQAPVNDLARIAKRPALRPLVNAMEVYDHYAIVLVDRERARFLRLVQGEVQEEAEIVGTEIHRHKQADGRGGSVFQRRADEAASRNLRDAAETVVRLFESSGCEKLLLGGMEESVKAFRDLLPRSLQEAAAANINIDMEAPTLEVARRALEVIEELDKREKAALADTLITMANKGEGATTGIADVLALLRMQRVRTLVVEESFSVPGVGCEACGLANSGNPSVCPMCGGEMVELPDVVDTAVRMALKQDVELVIMPDDTKLASAGRIGAFLRY